MFSVSFIPVYIQLWTFLIKFTFVYLKELCNAAFFFFLTKLSLGKGMKTTSSGGRFMKNKVWRTSGPLEKYATLRTTYL